MLIKIVAVRTAGVAAAAAAAGRGPMVCVDVFATRCVDMTRVTCEAGLMVLNGGLGAVGRMAPGIFWKG